MLGHKKGIEKLLKNKVTIPGNKKTKSKQFKVGDIWIFRICLECMDVIARVKEIKNNQIIFENIVSKRINRASTKQFGIITRSAKKATRKKKNI
jgi:hypothetical protein